MATERRDDAITQRILRITDIAEEPLEYLAPISGYAKMPLVPLEEAVEPLVPILPAVQRYAYAAKQRCKKPADGLSQDESASIMLYTMGWAPHDECLYVALNATLRSADRQQKLKPWYLYLRLFLSALFRLPPLSKIAYRGIELDLSKRYIEGETIVWWGFSSCITTPGIVQSELFSDETGTKTMFTIHCESARDIRQHSYHAAKDEVLLLAGTQFKVTSCLEQDDLHIIQLEETHASYSFLQPVPTVSQSSNPFSTVTTSAIIKSTLPTKKVTTLVLPQPTAVNLPKPKQQNVRLEKLIAENKGGSELILEWKSLTDQDMEIVAYYVLQNNTVIITLNLSINQIGAEGAKYLSDPLRSNRTLTTLNLSKNQIGAQGTQHLSDALINNTTLTTLDIGSNQIGDKGTQYLSDVLRNNTKLTTLNVSNNQIGSEGAQHLSDALKQNMKLMTLNLWSNQIGDKGAQHLSDGLQKNMNLTTLDLGSNQIGDNGTKHLSDALLYNLTLKTLLLKSNYIGTEGAEYLTGLTKINRKLKWDW